MPPDCKFSSLTTWPRCNRRGVLRCNVIMQCLNYMSRFKMLHFAPMLHCVDCSIFAAYQDVLGHFLGRDNFLIFTVSTLFFFFFSLSACGRSHRTFQFRCWTRWQSGEVSCRGYNFPFRKRSILFQEKHVIAHFHCLKEVQACVHPPSPQTNRLKKFNTHYRSRARLLLTATLWWL